MSTRIINVCRSRATEVFKGEIILNIEAYF